MIKYCSECEEVYYADKYNYCPICSSKLRDIHDDYIKIKKFIESINAIGGNKFKIDEEKKIIRFKWNDRWLSTSFDSIIQNYNNNSDSSPDFIEVCSSKKDWDKQLKKDLPYFKRRLTYTQVKKCIELTKWAESRGCNGKSKFIKPLKIAEFDTDEILGALKNDGLICGFKEIRKNELFMALIKSNEGGW